VNKHLQYPERIVAYLMLSAANGQDESLFRIAAAVVNAPGR
jgi:hypothetical protein